MPPCLSLTGSKATGTAILFAALLSIVWLKMKPSDDWFSTGTAILFAPRLSG